MQLVDIRLTRFGTIEPRGTAAELSELAGSMRAVGLIHPVVVNGKHEIVAGRRRVAAARSLEWSHIKAVVCETFNDIKKAILAEQDENTCRVALKPSEKKELADRVRAAERPLAEKREKSGQKPAFRPSGNLPEGRKGEVNEIAAKAAGTSRKNLEKIDAVVHAAEQNPERYGDLRDQMDDSGKVDPAFKEFQKRQEEDAKKAALAAVEESPADRLRDGSEDYCKRVRDMGRSLDEARRTGEELSKERIGFRMHWQSILHHITTAKGSMNAGMPAHKCPYCKGEGASDDSAECKGCRGFGYVDRGTYKAGCASVGCPDESGADE